MKLELMGEMVKGKKVRTRLHLGRSCRTGQTFTFAV
jgi:hypothetical protein